MENLVTLEFDVAPSDPAAGLELEVWVDQQKIFDSAITADQKITHQFDDNVECEHELQIVLKNKTDQHTTVDEQGNILKDATIQIQNIKLDSIELGYMFNQIATYTHNHNGHGPQVNEQFFNCMGCNGTVSMKFSSPVYLWLLENM